MDYESLKKKFIEQIDSANTIRELAVIEKNQYEEKSDLVKGATGYKYPTDVPKNMFRKFQTDRRKIFDKLDMANEIYRRKDQISRSHTGVHDSIPSQKIIGGKRRKTRNSKSKKTRKSKSRKNRARSNRRHR